VALTLALILALAAYLRLANLGANPGWDGDEGYNWNIAANLAAGHVRMFALQFAFVQHPPLFFLLGAAAFRLLGQDMVVLRGVAVLCCLATVGLLFVAGRLVGSSTTGLLAAGLFAIAPQIVVQNRFAYTYNLLMLLTLLACVLLLSLVTRLAPADATPPGARQVNSDGAARDVPEWHTLAALSLVAGLALATDQEAVYLLPPLVVLVVLWVRRRGTRAGRGGYAVLALAALPPAAYIGAMLVTRPAAFLFDVVHTAGRVGGGSVIAQLYLLAFNLDALLRFDVWIPLGLAGLLLVRHARQRVWLVFVVACALLVILKVRTPNPLFRTAEPLWPFVALGLALATEAFASRLAGTVAELASGARRARALGTAAVILALVPVGFVSIVADLTAMQTHISTPIDGLLPRSPAAARQLAAWLNTRVHPDDLILAMPQIAWLLHCRTAELLQAAAITGAGTAFYPAGIPATRWAYDVHLARARYLVVDDFTRAWIAENRTERLLVGEARAHWPAVYRHGEYTVYANPARALSRPQRG
jgi:4-amino-4-deoxy-L-arabinose transferase-like glycosyltransferase